MDYEAPAITELGSIADFTRGSWHGSNFDGRGYRSGGGNGGGGDGGGGIPTS